MQRKIRRKRSYDVSYVGGTVAAQAPDIDDRKIRELARVLERRPSPEFVKAYSFLLRNYLAERLAVSRAAPPAIRRRLCAVLNHVQALQGSLNVLHSTDSGIFGLFATKRYLKGEPYTELNELKQSLAFFLPVMREAVELTDKQPPRGRMPSFAEEGLAQGLGLILREETGVEPRVTRHGQFDRLLRLAFVHAGQVKPRRDTVDLLKAGLRHLRDGDANERMSLLPYFRVGTIPAE